jgi:two-component system, chemotaxis family, sensor kinase CheA
VSSGDDEVRIDVAHFQAAFLAEARELVAAFEASLLALEQIPDDPETINEAFRNAHSIKGAAGAAGRVHLAELTHALETLLDALRSHAVQVAAPHFTAMYRAADLLGQLLGDADEAVVHAARALAVELIGFVSAPGAAHAQPEREARAEGAADEPLRVRVRLEKDAYQWGGDPLLSLREISELAQSMQVTLDDASLPDITHLVPEEAYFRFAVELVPGPELTKDRVREAFSFFDGVAHLDFESARGAAPVAPTLATSPSTPPPAKLEPGAASPKSPAQDATIRVATEKIDKVIDLVGELVIAHSAIRELTREPTPQRLMALSEAVLVAERHLRELQERVMSVRMIPVGTVFSRLPRMVRDVSTKLGKDVRLVLEGADTELDKTLIEKLTDPLMHMVRNAVDHGIETPELRVAAGKPAQATLHVRGYARAGSVFVEVEDDGRGLDRERIRETAIERGLISASDQLTDDGIYKLICSPGFSTKREVTDVSGRGVGLDVVQKNIEALSGDLHISSAVGKGTRFTMRLPLTLTIVDGLMLATSAGACVLPLTDVAFSLQIGPHQARTLAGAGDVLDLPGETLPLLDLAEVLQRPPTGGERGRLAVVVNAGNVRYALRVEGLLGQAQSVVKSLETHYRRVPGVMGATILGDGRVALILDGLGLALAAGLSRGREAARGTHGKEREVCTLPQ